jgi:hypothetical protein
MRLSNNDYRILVVSRIADQSIVLHPGRHLHGMM